jgi:biotin carboxyl carrier protein
VASRVRSGWRNVPTAHQRIEYDGAVVEYRFTRAGLDVLVDGAVVDVELAAASPTAVDLTVDGTRRTARVERVRDTVYVDDPTGSSTLVEVERFPLPAQYVDPGSLLAPMPGSVVRVLGRVGDQVAAGDPLIVIEAMKMEHRIDAPTAGPVAAFLVEVGQQVDTGTLLATVADNPDTDLDNDSHTGARADLDTDPHTGTPTDLDTDPATDLDIETADREQQP